jgi:hypothetical protein
MQKYVDNSNILKIHKENARDIAINQLNWSINAKNFLEIFNDNLHNKRKQINPNIVTLLNRLDKLYKPSDSYRIIYSIYTFLKHKKCIINGK